MPLELVHRLSSVYNSTLVVWAIHGVAHHSGVGRMNSSNKVISALGQGPSRTTLCSRQLFSVFAPCSSYGRSKRVKSFLFHRVLASSMARFQIRVSVDLIKFRVLLCFPFQRVIRIGQVWGHKYGRQMEGVCLWKICTSPARVVAPSKSVASQLALLVSYPSTAMLNLLFDRRWVEAARK